MLRDQRLPRQQPPLGALQMLAGPGRLNCENALVNATKSWSPQGDGSHANRALKAAITFGVVCGPRELVSS